MKTLLVTDTNILIDLLTANLEGMLFQIGAEICTTDFVMGELTQTDERTRMEKFVEAGLLRVMSFEDVEPILALPVKRAKLKIADRSALFVAIQEQAILLTGDNPLKQESLENGLEAHGSIWLFDKFVVKGLITPSSAYQVLENITTTGQRWIKKELIDGFAVKWNLKK